MLQSSGNDIPKPLYFRMLWVKFIKALDDSINVEKSRATGFDLSRHNSKRTAVLLPHGTGRFPNS